jgi:hypothetical protein
MCCDVRAVYTFANISGAHLNPAVSFALMCTGHMKWWKGLLYMVMQVWAGIAVIHRCTSTFAECSVGVMQRCDARQEASHPAGAVGSVVYLDHHDTEHGHPCQHRLCCNQCSWTTQQEAQPSGSMSSTTSWLGGGLPGTAHSLLPLLNAAVFGAAVTTCCVPCYADPGLHFRLTGLCWPHPRPAHWCNPLQWRDSTRLLWASRGCAQRRAVLVGGA